MTQTPSPPPDPFLALMQQYWANPVKATEMQVQLWHDWMQLWQESALRFMGGRGQELYRPEKGDRRFRAPEWEKSAVFDFIKQSYLLTSKWMQSVVKETDGLDSDTRAKLDFYTRQFADALSPSNFPLTNPEVLRETIESKGENLVRGFRNLMEDLERGHGELRIRTTDSKAFTLGENIAATPGRIVFQNDLIQLIQYAPSTETVHKTPLLVIPPWINKYYILDLKPENSFVKWLVDQGHTVFMISWINPGPALADKDFGDYMQDGALAALDHIAQATGEDTCNVIGYCLGGTLLTTLLAWLESKGQDGRVASATFLTTLIDFSAAGDFKLFIDEAQMNQLETNMKEKGLFPAEQMKHTFAMLRANDMIWSFVVNNYLMGREPFPFDLLYWNDDSTNMPAAMHSFYLRKCYLENKLAQPGGIQIKGVPVDVSKITTPAFFLSTREDHIAPWRATYSGISLLGGPVTFVLSASGHVAGVVNAPASKKYCYWYGATDKKQKNPDAWLDAATPHDGSWWPHWQEWVSAYAGEKIPARTPADGLEPAPGSYVRMKAE